VTDDPDLAVELHETRHLLALARGYLETVADGALGPLSDRQREVLRRVDDKIRQASRQLGDIGHVSQADVQRPRPADLTIEIEVRHAVDRALDKSELRRASIDFHLARETWANADPVLLARILDNLLDNALSYSPGTPRLVLETGHDPKPFIRVRDAGVGLEPEVAAHVFDKGFREHPDDDLRPGSGIGLYISRQSAEAMGGSLKLEWTRAGVGSVFRLELSPPQSRTG
jgi:signal transduction histidine kinase